MNIKYNLCIIKNKKMEKGVTLSKRTSASIRSIQLYNNDSVFSIGINKEWLFNCIRRIGIIAAIIFFIAITVFSYEISPVYFWTNVKTGTILILLSIIALRNN